MRDVTTNSTGLFQRSIALAAQHPDREYEYRGECCEGLFEIEVLPVQAEPAKRRVILTRDGPKRYDDFIPVDQLGIHVDALLKEMLGPPKAAIEAAAPAQPTGQMGFF